MRMTAKRFDWDFNGIWDFQSNSDEYLESSKEICELLNEQHETIERLKQNINELLSVNVEEDLLKENEELKTKNNAYIQDIEVFKEENTHLKLENEQLKQENQRMTDKLNQLALEFLNYDMVTMGKATEISEMCYYDFLKYRKENGNPMELQL